MASVDLGSVHGKLILDTSGWDSGVDSAKQKLAGLGVVSGEESSKVTNHWQQVGQKMQAIGAQMSLAITTPLVLFGKQAVQTAAEFDSTMRTIAAVGGIGEERLGELEQKAIEFGRRGVFSAQQVATAMTDMVRDGLDPATEGFEKQIEAAHNLAAAAGVELYDAQIALSNSMFNFGMSADQAGEASDILANVLNKTQLELEDVGASMSYVGPIAETAGLSFAQTAAAIGIMGQAGIKGSMAGTTLRRALINLQAPTDAQAEALQGLGIKIFDSEGKMKDFNTILEDFNSALYESHDVTVKVGGATKEQSKEISSYQKKIESLNTSIEKYNAGISGASLSDEKRKEKVAQLQKEIGFYQDKINGVNVADEKYIKQTKKLTEEQRIQAVETIFGAQAVSGMLAVIEEGPGVFGEMTDSMNEQGTAARIAEERQVGLSYSMNRLKSASFELSKSVGDTLAPMIEKLAIAMEGISRWFGDLDPKWQTVIVSALGLAAAIGPLLVVIGTLATWIAPGGVLAVGFGVITSAIGGLASFIFATAIPAIAAFVVAFWPIILVAGLVAGAAYLIWKNWGTIGPMLANFWETIKVKWGEFIGWVTTAWNNVVVFFRDTLPQKIQEGWNKTITFFTELPGKMLNFGIGIIQGLINGIVQSVANLLFTIGFIIGLFIYGLPAIYNWLVENVPIWWNNFIQWMVDLIPRIQEQLRQWWQRIVNWGTDTWNYLKVEIPRIFNNIIAWFAAMPGRIWTWLVEMFNKIVNWGVDTWNYLSEAIPRWFNNVVTWFAELPGRVYEKLNNLKESVADAVNNAKAKMSEIIHGWLDTAKRWGENIARAFVDGFGKLGEWIKDKVQAGLNAAKSMIQGESPPKEGPFKNIDKWGENVASAWVEGFGSKFANLDSLLSDSMPKPGYAFASSGSGQPQQVNNVTNAPQMTVQIGVYAGLEMEKREIARQLFEAYDDYQKGIGASING